MFGGLRMTFDDARDDFSRLHRQFTLPISEWRSALSWLTALYAAANAPWVRNIRR